MERRIQNRFLSHIHTLTLLWYDVQCDCEPSIFDEFDNVCVGHADDGLSIHSQDPITHLQLPTAVSWAALDYAANFMGNSWKQTTDKGRCQHQY